MTIKYYPHPVRSFECDQKGIDQLKNEFFENAEDFVYYRKGEWGGIAATTDFVKIYLLAHPGIVVSPMDIYPAIVTNIDKIFMCIVAYPGARMLIKDTKKVIETIRNIIGKFSTDNKELNQISCRVITSLTEDNKKYIPEWEKLCGKGGVCIIPKEQTGYFRYFVNDKEFCILCRIDDNKLQGIRGKDPIIIKMLRDKFNEEFFIGKYLDEENKE